MGFKHIFENIFEWGIIHIFVFGFFGIIGLLVDLDHLLVLFIKGLPVTLENLARHAGRPLHGPLVIFGWGFVLICGALFLRLFIRVVNGGNHGQ